MNSRLGAFRHETRLRGFTAPPDFHASTQVDVVAI